jgi:hypothetical protein
MARLSASSLIWRVVKSISFLIEFNAVRSFSALPNRFCVFRMSAWIRAVGSTAKSMQMLTTFLRRDTLTQSSNGIILSGKERLQPHHLPRLKLLPTHLLSYL